MREYKLSILLYLYLNSDSNKKTKYYQKKIKKTLKNYIKVTKEELLNINDYFNQLNYIKKVLIKDQAKAFEKDPSIKNINDVVLISPGYFGVSLYRAAHELTKFGLNICAKMIMNEVHSLTGIDIHPKAVIGEGFFIDHGTGVVIGETSIIGCNVTIYQGVTIGALSLNNTNTIRNTKRHPTIGNNVTIYANATILGKDTTIGDSATIGAGMFITKSVEANTIIRKELC